MRHITVIIVFTPKYICAQETYCTGYCDYRLPIQRRRTYLGSLLELRRQLRLEARQVIYDLGCRARRHQIRGVAKPTPGS